MHLLLLPLLPLLLVPLFVTAIIVFAVGAVLMRILFVVALLFMAAAFLLGGGILRGLFRGCCSASSKNFWGRRCRRFDDQTSRDLDNSAFDEYRRATLRRLEDEAREFRTFLAKLRAAADAADFQAFLKARRAEGRHSS